MADFNDVHDMITTINSTSNYPNKIAQQPPTSIPATNINLAPIFVSWKKKVQAH